MLNIKSLSFEKLIGAISGSCVVSSANEEHLCTYELEFFFDLYFYEGEGLVGVAEHDDEEDEIDVDEFNVGSVTAAGSLWYANDHGGYLIVESTALSVEDYDGGIMVLQYISVDDDFPIFEGYVQLE